jgi:molybdate transport system substrate-binding protein
VFVARLAAGSVAGLVVALAAGLVGLAGCGTDDQPSAGDGVSGDLSVFAAASLTEAFEEIADGFTEEHPDVEVVFNFAGSQTLASQINEGAPADVFASADTHQMDAVAAAGGLAGGPEVFTSNLLAIAVEPGNPLGIETLADLADPDLLLVLPAEEVPAGRYAREALRAAGVSVSPVSLERDVRAALSKVALGEADASIVYASDVVAAGDSVEGIEIPMEDNIPATHLVAALPEAGNRAAAEAFVGYVLGEKGQGILQDHGFSEP